MLLVNVVSLAKLFTWMFFIKLNRSMFSIFKVRNASLFQYTLEIDSVHIEKLKLNEYQLIPKIHILSN